MQLRAVAAKPRLLLAAKLLHQPAVMQRQAAADLGAVFSRAFFGKLHSKLHKSSCCDAAPSCGCEVAAPSCGCEAPAPTCCEAPAPTCCEAPAPSCGCEVAADPCCKPARHHHLAGLLSKLKGKMRCCAPAPSCGCEVAAPSCGCGAPAPSCGCGS